MSLDTAGENADQVAANTQESCDYEQPVSVKRRTFAEPEISFPVDVLEATTFFQGTDSGVSN